MEPVSVISFPRGWSTRLGVWSYPAKGKGGEGALKSACMDHISPNAESRLHK